MPQGFAFPLDQEFWLSLGSILPSLQEATHLKMDVFARLKKGVSTQEAQVELNLLAKYVDESFGSDNRSEQGLVVVRPFVEAYTRAKRRTLSLMTGAVLGVLLIGCANVTNLLLARWTVRRRELAVRAALGAGQWVLARNVLFDALALAGLGAVAGLGIAVSFR